MSDDPFEVFISGYASEHGLPERVAIRHAALRRALADLGGMVTDLGALKMNVEQKCGFEISREEVERDLAFLKRLARREAAGRE